MVQIESHGLCPQDTACDTGQQKASVQPGVLSSLIVKSPGICRQISFNFYSQDFPSAFKGGKNH